MIPLLHTPEGVRDIYGSEKRELRALSDCVCNCMRNFGFEEIQTPSFEYFDVFSSERGTVPSKDMYKFIDRDGNTLVLRPDMTPQIARAAVTYWKNAPAPIRLSYIGNTFINNSGYQLRLKETTQAGVEIFGDDSCVADAEVIALTVECLRAAGLTEFQIEIGNAGFFRAIANSCGLTSEDEEELRRRIKDKNLFGISDFLAERNIAGKEAELLLALPELFGSEEILSKASSLTDNEAALAAIARLQSLWDCLTKYGVQKFVSFDLAMLSKYRYYTGIIFRAITYGTGEAIASGGRYDSLAGQFGEPTPAIGMSITLDSLLTVLQRMGLEERKPSERYAIVYRAEQVAEAIAMACGKRVEGIPVALVPDGRGVKDALEKEGVIVWNI
ncbi:MAG: ATP phosphoribosyltransferase regulatory subunit [Lachnospiraceae bacterium]|nr:ATP phosphoribosyltransferase regulatory subunit [Lachnospiraceae bacterium]